MRQNKDKWGCSPLTGSFATYTGEVSPAKGGADLHFLKIEKNKCVVNDRKCVTRYLDWVPCLRRGGVVCTKTRGKPACCPKEINKLGSGYEKQGDKIVDFSYFPPP